MPNFVEISLWFWKTRLWIAITFFYYYYLYLKQKVRDSFEIGPVVLEKKDEYVQSSHTYDRRTDGWTDDGQHAIKKAHLSFQWRWAQNQGLKKICNCKQWTYHQQVVLKHAKKSIESCLSPFWAEIWSNVYSDKSFKPSIFLDFRCYSRCNLFWKIICPVFLLAFTEIDFFVIFWTKKRIIFVPVEHTFILKQSL